LNELVFASGFVPAVGHQFTGVHAFHVGIHDDLLCGSWRALRHGAWID
jgi:hypothetical protein